MIYTLRIYELGSETKTFQSDKKEKIWEEIGKTWSPYDVRDERDNIVEEFVPY